MLVQSFLEQRLGSPPQQLEVIARTLRGGLESPDVRLVVAQLLDARGRSRVVKFVIKRATEREAGIYRAFASKLAVGLSPRLLHIESTPEGPLLFLEAIPRVRSWPWKDVRSAESVLRALAPIHRAPASAAVQLPTWDYEAELSDSALSTLNVVQQARHLPDLSRLARSLPAIRRTVLHLPAMRQQLLAFTPLGTAAIHGDVHPGNAIMRKRTRGGSPVLVDWGRARWGSPLEDAASWLQSLRYWEPAAGQRHDTLLSAYASVLGERLNAPLREVYWLAAASNALAGALRYHVLVAGDDARDIDTRAGAARAAVDQVRVIVRADALWS